MKAGLITFHYAHHYGAQLQAYALMKTVQSLGVECEIINYVRPDTETGNRLFKHGIGLRQLLSNIHTLIHYKSFKNRQERYSDFVKEQMSLSAKSYTTFEELVKEPPQYDAYICGSDQIWNPFIYHTGDFDPSFFMPFAGKSRKIAYAPSFGVSSMPEDKKEALKAYLSDFDFLSVREKQGEAIIWDLLKRPSLTVLDPTLLLDASKWAEIAIKPKYDEPYILCYFVSSPSPWFKIIKQISEASKLSIVTLCGSRASIPGSVSTILDAGPREFLGLFQHASMVCTNSFHGTVFSINNKKDFYSFSSFEHNSKTVNSRLHSILGILGLENRMMTSDMADLDVESAVAEHNRRIDYTKVDELLKAERDKSIQYLSDALK